jgi:hypothetical protein
LLAGTGSDVRLRWRVKDAAGDAADARDAPP